MPTAEETAAAAAAAAAAATPWYKDVPGVDDTIVGHWKNRGWDTKKPAEVALEATKAWKEAEKFVGAPAESLLRVPKDAADEAGWNTVWSRLGKPKDAKEYDFSAIKLSDGTGINEDLANSLRAAAFKLHVPKDAAAGLTAEFVKFLDGADAAERTQKAADLAIAKTALAKNWGANLDSFKFVAGRAAAALGIAPEVVSALETGEFKGIGYDKIMDMFLKIGQKIGEDKYITGGLNTGTGGAMTRDQAIAKKADLMKDVAWRESYLKGDVAKGQEMLALNIIITGDTESPPVRKVA